MGIFLFISPSTTEAHKLIKKAKEASGMIADWFIAGLYIVFIVGVIMYAYYEIRNK